MLTTEQFDDLLDDLKGAYEDAPATKRAARAEAALTAEREVLLTELAQARAEAAVLRASLDGAHICEDCRGTGIIGHTAMLKPVACETCGGHEDSRGRGIIFPGVPDGAAHLLPEKATSHDR